LKKIIVIIIAFIIGVLLYKKEEFVIIPNESIRIRIVANSDNIEDLVEKKRLKEQIEDDIYEITKDANSIEEARSLINDNLKNIDTIIKNNIDLDYTIDYGVNYFPKKVYRGVLYEAGNYESLVITLGSGLGENWWCVLFPPLCLIEDNKTTSDVEYKLYVEEILGNWQLLTIML